MGALIIGALGDGRESGCLGGFVVYYGRGVSVSGMKGLTFRCCFIGMVDGSTLYAVAIM